MATTAPVQPVITGFSNVPEFAKGLVRDLRIRWALEEVGRGYDTDLFDAMIERPARHRARQPFGQVPTFHDGTVDLFESGAILLYLGEQDERLLPTETQARWKAIAWLFAGLNSVEPGLAQITMLDLFQRGKDWTEEARKAAVGFATTRLACLSDSLGQNAWLTDRFTIADIVMVTVLRSIAYSDVLDPFPNLITYRERGEARPAFIKALADQMAGFVPADQGEQP